MLDEARRALDHQRGLAAELRGGASLLIATAAIAISLLDPAERVGTFFGWLAVTAFVVVCVAALTVIWPHGRTLGGVDIAAMVRKLTTSSYCEAAPGEVELQRRLILSMATHHRLNAERLTRVANAFRTGALVLVVQLLATVAARIATS